MNDARTLIDVLKEASQLSERGITFIGSESARFLSYKELYDYAGIALSNLTVCGVRPGDQVILQLKDEQNFLIAFWGCLLGGIIPVPLAIGGQVFYKEKFISTWNILSNPFLIHDGTALKDVVDYGRKNELHALCEDIDARAIDITILLQGNKVAETETPEENQIAYIQFSSGSTGQAKGVVLTHKNLVANITDIAARSQITSHDSMLSWMPLTHDMGLICFHLTGVICGINQFIIPTALFVKRPLLWMNKASEYKITLLYSPNFGYHYLLTALGDNNHAWDLSAVRLIYNGAEPISDKLIHEFMQVMKTYGLSAHTMYPGYGMAEACVAVTLAHQNRPYQTLWLDRNVLQIGKIIRELPAQHKKAVPFVSVGSPVDQCSIRICDNDDRILPNNYIGHIQIKGTNTTKGYYNNKEANKKLFTADKWLRTGDLGFISDNVLTVTGRAKNLIIINGQNYYPQDIENAILDIEGLTVGNVVACGGRQDARGEETLLVFILFRRSPEFFLPVIKEVESRLFTRIGLIVDRVIPVKNIPRTSSGKIQHYKLFTDYHDGKFDVVLSEIDRLKKQNEQSILDPEKRILNVLQSLGLQQLDVNDNFLGAGINSLMATQVIHRLSEAGLGSMTIGDFFAASTVRDLIKQIASNQKAEGLTLEKISDKYSYALSPAQKRFWLLDQYADHSNVASVTASFKIQGRLNVEVLKNVFEKLIGRHESLRTVIDKIDNEPRQIIRATGHLDFIIIKINNEDQSTVDATLSEAHRAVFHLQEGPLFKVTLLQVDEINSILCLSFHHIIIDGWSVNILIDEMSELYIAELAHKRDHFQSLEWHPKDYAEALEKVRGQGYWNADLHYWKNQFEERSLPINLPFAKPRPSVLTFDGQSIDWNFHDQTFENLQKISQQLSVTPFMVLFAALKILISKHTGSSEITLGAESAARDYSQVRNMVGCFVNALPIKSHIDANKSFTSFLATEKTKLLEAYQHQMTPFDFIVKAIADETDPSRSPLFDLLVLYQNFDLSFEKAKAHFTATYLPLRKQAALVDLQFEFLQFNERLAVSVTYNNNLFEEKDITYFIKHFDTLLNNLLAKPEAVIGDISFQSDEELAQVLQFSNSGPKIDRNDTLISLFDRMVDNVSNATAIVEGDQHFTYRYLQSSVTALTGILLTRFNITKGDKIIIFSNRSADAIVSILSILKAGALFVPIDPEYPKERVKSMLHEIQPSLIITDKQEYDTLTKEYEVECKIFNLAIIPEFTVEFFKCEDRSALDSLAYIIYTSGSTGKPKGIVIGHRAMVDYILTFTDYFKINSDDRVIHQSSLSFDTFLEEIFPVLLAGGKVIISREGGKNIADLQQTLTQEKATILSTTPWVLNELNRKPASCVSLKAIISGGDALQANHINNLLLCGLNIYNTYGPAEATVCATFHHIKHSHACNIIGKPISNHQIYIVNSQMKLQAVGVPGEICIAGTGLAECYYNMDQHTREKFVPNPFSSEGRLYKTGDRGRWLTDGAIAFEGRSDNQVKIRGYRIELEEIENQLQGIESINNAVVLAYEVEDGEKNLIGFYSGENSISSDDLRMYLMDRLPFYMVPSYFIWLPDIPLTISGKPNTQALHAVLSQHKPDRIKSLPQNKIEAIILRLFTEVFEDYTIGADHNFFELGGNSLTASVLIPRIGRELKKEITLRTFFLNPTVTKLAAYYATEESVHEIQRIKKTDKKKFYPLSHSQKRIWVLYHLEQNPIAYNLSWALSIKGKLNIAALNHAFALLINRYDVLRTTFALVGYEPKQVVLEPEVCTFEMRYIDLKNHSEPTRVVDKLIHEKVTTPIALDVWPLFRAEVLETGDAEFVFTFFIHHIIIDGWSLNIFAKELSALYNAYVSGDEPALPEQRIQYADFVEWQEDEMNKESLRAEKDFWINQFREPVSRLELPTDFSRPSIQTYRGKSLDLFLSEKLKHEIVRLSEKYSSSLFTILLATVKLMLFNYTKQTDIVIGVPVAGRDHVDIQDQLGLFLNVLPVRTYINAEQSFGSMLTQVNNSFLTALENQHYPFDALIHDLRLPVDTSRSPLFDVMVGFQDIRTANTALDGLKDLSVTLYPYYRSISQFDLSIDFFDVAEGIQCKVEYNTDLFSEIRITHMIHHFETLLEAVLKYDQHIISSFAIIPSFERKELEQFNPPLPSQRGSQVFPRHFESKVNESPKEIAVIYQNTKLTYQQLNSSANKLAHLLRNEFNIQAHKPVGLFVNRNKDMIVFVMAIFKAGGIFVPLDPNSPLENLRYILHDSSIEYVITDDEKLSEVPVFQGNVINVKTLQPLLAKQSEENLDVALCLDDPAYIIYTSGSTGKPKGVLVSYKNLEAISNAWGKAYNLEHERPILLQLANITFDVFIGDLCRALLFGGTLVICPWEDRLNPAALYHLLQAHRITLFESTGALIFPLMEYLRDQKLDIPYLKLLIIGSDVCHNSDINILLKQYPKLRIINSYGTTETTIDSSFYEPKEIAASVTGVVPIGKPLSGTQYYVLDSSLRLLPIGVRGILYIGGLGVAAGYINRTELTAQKFIDHPEYGRLYNTGDQVKWQFSGDLEFLGREDTQIKIRGHRVELGEIENVILQLNKSIRKVCVVLLQPRQNASLLCAFYESDKPIDESILVQEITPFLAGHMRPDRYIYKDALPLSSNGKIARNKLAVEFDGINIKRAGVYEAPSNTTEEMLAEIWRNVLHVDTIGVNDNFFDCGGHSLKAFQIVIRCQRMNLAINHIDIFLNPTIRELARKISLQRDFSQNNIEPLEEQDHYPVSKAQKTLWLVDQVNPNSTAYHMPAAFHMTGSVSLQALEHAFDALVFRHEILRTVFLMKDGEIRQRILPEGPAFKLIINTQYGNKHLDEIENRIAFILKEPFDLSTGPLIRMAVFKLHNDAYFLVFNMHHIISDEWSAEILMREFTAAYNEQCANTDSSLRALNIQYRDYAVWSNLLMDGKKRKEAEEYWLQQFKDGFHATSIPSDFSRSTNADNKAEELVAKFDRTVVDAVKKLCYDQQVTPYMIFVSCVIILLHKYTEEENVTVGSLLAGREQAVLENQIGFYVNTLPLTISFDKNESCKSLLLKVKSATVEGFRFGYYPYDELIDQLGLQTSNGHVALFRTMVNLKNSLNEEKAMNALKGIVVKQHPLKPNDAKMDLIFNFFEDPDFIHLSIDYNTSLFHADTIQRLVLNFENILHQFSSNPTIPITSLEVLSDQQKAQILSFNPPATVRKFQDPVHKLFERQVQKTPEHVAVIAGNCQLSYAKLNQKANQIANYLMTKYHVMSGDLVGLSVSRNENILIGILGILKTGAAYLPIDKDYPELRKRYIIDDSNVKIILHDGDTQTDRIISLQSPEIDYCESTNPERPVSLNDLAYVIYTSGSTGKPKGVQIEHRSVLNLVEWLHDNFYKQSPLTAMLTASINFDASVQQLFPPLINGSTLIISSDASKKDPAKFVNDLLFHRVNIVDVTPSYLNILLPEMKEVKPGDLKYVLVGGEFISTRTTQEFYSLFSDAELINVYGPTETTVDSTFCWLRNEQERPGIIGVPLDNTKVYILDRSAKLVPIGVYGELYIGGAGVGRGYLNRPELTHERYVDHPFSKGEKLYRTGDIGRWCVDRKLELSGRNDAQVKVRGFRIELGEIENCLLQHADISGGIVSAYRDVDDTTLLVAYYIERYEHCSKSGIKKFLEAQLPSYMIPNYFIPIQSIPLTAHGKIDHDALPKPTVELAERKAAVEVEDSQESSMLEILMEELHTNLIAETDNFFDLGGHSLKAMKVVSRVQKEMGLSIEIKHIFQNPIIADLFKVLKSLPKIYIESIPPVEQQEYYSLSHTQKQLWIATQLDVSEKAYIIQGAYEWEGPLYQAAFSEAVNELIKRYEILRAQFLIIDGNPVQRVVPFEQLNFHVTYLKCAREDEVQHNIAGLCDQRFDLTKAPLLRITVITTTNKKNILVCSLHHLISDGWSAGILISQLIKLYQNILMKSAVVVFPSIGYKDYAVWHNNLLTTGQVDKAKEYWFNDITGNIKQFNLPVEHSQVEDNRHAVGIISQAMDQALSQAFRTLSSRHSMSPFMMFLAILNALFYRLTGEQDIIIGVPSANRDHPDIRDQIGFFVNTVPLKISVSGDMNFKSLVKQVKQKMLNASKYQSYPLNLIVEDIGLQGKNYNSPLFNVIALYVDKRNTLLSENMPDGVMLKELEISNAQSNKFDWQFTFSQNSDTINVTITYNTAKVSSDFVQRIFKYLYQIIEQIQIQEEVLVEALDLDDHLESTVEHRSTVDAFDFDF